jgi:addiction module HigA family antidote
MRAPTPPSVFVREDILEAFKLTQDELAQRLGVSRLTVNQLVNNRRAITAEMALRLSRLTGTTAEFWMNLQQKVDLWEANQKISGDLDAIQPLTSGEDTERPDT